MSGECGLCGQEGRLRRVEIPEDVRAASETSQVEYDLCESCVALLHRKMVVTRTAARLGISEAEVERYEARRV